MARQRDEWPFFFATNGLLRHVETFASEGLLYGFCLLIVVSGALSLVQKKRKRPKIGPLSLF